MNVEKEPKAVIPRLDRVIGPNPHILDDLKESNIISMEMVESDTETCPQQDTKLILRCDSVNREGLKSHNTMADHILPVIFIMV